eukprot:19726-Heterococcus_DN1.PRE.2
MPRAAVVNSVRIVMLCTEIEKGHMCKEIQPGTNSYQTCDHYELMTVYKKVIAMLTPMLTRAY